MERLVPDEVKQPDYKPLKDLVTRILTRLEEHPDAKTAVMSVNRSSIEEAARAAQMDFAAAVDAIERRTACDCRPHSQASELMMCTRDDTQLVEKLAKIPEVTLTNEDGRWTIVSAEGEQLAVGPTLRQAIRSIRKPNPTTKEDDETSDSSR